MFKSYYIVINYVNGYPEFIHCINSQDGFVKINNLKQYLTEGKGVSDEIVDAEIGILINNKLQWKDNFINQLNKIP